MLLNLLESTFYKDILKLLKLLKRPPAFYAHLMEKEIMPISNLPQELYPLLKMYSDSHSRQIQTIKEYNDEIKEAVIPISSNVTNRNPINKSALLSQIPLMEGDDKVYSSHYLNNNS